MRRKDRFECSLLTHLNSGEKTVFRSLNWSCIPLLHAFLDLSFECSTDYWTSLQCVFDLLQSAGFQKGSWCFTSDCKAWERFKSHLTTGFKSSVFSISVIWKYLWSQGVGAALGWLKLWGVCVILLSFLPGNGLNPKVETESISPG